MQLYDATGQPKSHTTPLPLADGQLPTVQAAIYTSPAGTKSIARKLTLFNSNAAPQTIALFINVSGTPRPFRRVVLLQDESADVLAQEEAIFLDAADTIEAVTTTAAAVSYTIGGETWK